MPRKKYIILYFSPQDMETYDHLCQMLQKLPVIAGNF